MKSKKATATIMVFLSCFFPEVVETVGDALSKSNLLRWSGEDEDSEYIGAR